MRYVRPTHLTRDHIMTHKIAELLELDSLTIELRAIAAQERPKEMVR